MAAVDSPQRRGETPTHEVFNQPPPLEDYDVARSDRVLIEGVKRYGAPSSADELSRIGRLAGSAESIALGFAANANPPVLHTYDRFGHRIDEVEFHPAWHRLLEVAVGQGMHGTPWSADEPGAHVARAASSMCGHRWKAAWDVPSR